MKKELTAEEVAKAVYDCVTVILQTVEPVDGSRNWEDAKEERRQELMRLVREQINAGASMDEFNVDNAGAILVSVVVSLLAPLVKK